MKSILLGALLLLQIPAFAYSSPGMPKKSVMITDIGNAPVEVILSNVDLSQLTGKCVNHQYLGTSIFWMEQVKFNQKVTLTVGNETYQSIEGGYMVYNDGSKNCVQNISDISMIRIFLSHSKLTDQMITVDLYIPENVMSLKTNSGLSVSGLVVENY